MKTTSAKKWMVIALLLLFFAELGGMFLPSLTHELMGCLFLLVVILHNIANRQFYEHFFQGKNTARRLVNKVSILLLSIGIFFIAVSGVTLSHNLFSEISFGEGINWRSLHLTSVIGTLVLLFVHLLCHAGRYIQGRGFSIAAGLAFVLAAAGIFGLPYLDRWYHQVHVEREKIAHGEKVSFPGQVITVYFSRVGNTDFPPDVDAVSGASVMKDWETLIGNAEMIAYMVHDAVGGDIFAIHTKDKYPIDYGETTKVGKYELETKESPALTEPLPDLSGYDVIFVVYPLWWNTLPMAMEGFLGYYDLTGKIIVPIVTHGGGGIGDSIARIREVTNAHIPEEIIGIYSSDIPAARREIAAYLKVLQKSR